MSARYGCALYPHIRVGRGDNTYITFRNGVADVFDERDEEILKNFDYVKKIGPVPAEVAPTGRELGPKLDPNVVNWHSPLYGMADGYGNSAERMILALEATGKTVCTDPAPVTSSHETLLANVFKRSPRYGAVRIMYQPPTQTHYVRKWPHQPVIGFTMWEDDRVPPVWAKAIRQVDALFTCSQFCMKIFREFLDEHGIPIPLFYVPLGVDGTAFPYKRRSYVKGRDTFTVLHTSTAMWDERKGGMEAYRAFAEAFKGRDDVKLIMRAKFGRLPINDTRVEFREGEITEARKLEILYEAHCYLYPSFGEGFGLMPIEAIASGLPSIVSANSAMLDYTDLTWPVTCDPEQSRITQVFQKISFGQWARPRHEELVAHLRSIEGEYDKATNRAAKVAKAVRSRWGYDRSAAALNEAIEAVISCSSNRQRATSH
jgi:glycosyltransferase involved in cell wall biosynthesis